MKNKKAVLQEIIDYYIHSKDFNGIPSYLVSEEKVICELIDEGMVEVLADDDMINPYVRCFKITTPIECQKQKVLNHSLNAVLYPTEKALVGIEMKYNAKYTNMMQRGSNQFDVIYFDIEILERYINNPDFHIYNIGYRGEIYPVHYVEGDYIKDFGMAYMSGNTLRRAVGVFVSDLAKLSPMKQNMWTAFEHEDQTQWKIAPEFIENLILGEWCKSIWVFEALLEEIVIINKQCARMNIPKLFRHEYEIQDDVLRDYRYIYLPTLKNYNNFIMVLEKIVVSNVDKKAFMKNGFLVKGVKEDKNKGALMLFEEWLNINVTGNDKLREDIIIPLKELRKARQKPAHELQVNTMDINLYSEQCDLMVKVYTAVRNIRLIFANHPSAKTIEIPEYLFDGKNIVNY